MAAPAIDAPILVIKPEWLQLILNGEKTLEIRANTCRKTPGTAIFLSPSGSAKITGRAIFDGSIPIEDDDTWALFRPQHCVPGARPYRRTHAWRLSEVMHLENIPYAVRRGSIVWRKYRPAD